MWYNESKQHTRKKRSKMVASKLVFNNGVVVTPDNPTLLYIEGDGIGKDIWATAQKVFDAAVQKAYHGERKVEWQEVFAGEKAFNETGEWLPAATVDAIREHLVAIKGPLGTPTGGGHRSLNVTMRQELDLFVCLRPVQYFDGAPSPVKHPEKVDMVLFRENTEDIYAGIEWDAGTEDVRKVVDFLIQEMAVKNIRFPGTSSIGIKPISEEGSKRLIRAAFDYALTHDRKTVTIVHKGNIQKFTEGGFRRWGYELAEEEYAAQLESGELVVNDIIADNFLQQALLRPEQFEVVALTNLNGDYASDAVAAQVGGIGIAPGGNINYETGHAIFEATHGTAPDIAGKDMANPCSVLLSGAMMFDYIGWGEVGTLITDAIRKNISTGNVTGDFARLMENANWVGTKKFGDLLIEEF
jgi:isocitrate dehydrogenase